MEEMRLKDFEEFISQVEKLTPAQQSELLNVLEKMNRNDMDGIFTEKAYRVTLSLVRKAIANLLLLTGITNEGEPVYLEKNENTRDAGRIINMAVKLHNEIDYYLSPVEKEGDIYSEGDDYYLNDTRLTAGDIVELLTIDEDDNAVWRRTTIEHGAGGYYFSRYPNIPLEGATARLK